MFVQSSQVRVVFTRKTKKHFQSVESTEGRTHLEVLVVVGVDAEAGDKAVNHEIHICTLITCPPGEGLGWVKEQGLKEKRKIIRTV